VKIKFIGTSSGSVSLARFHSSFVIISDNYTLLVDTGDGISKALLSSGIDFGSISGILYSHMHPDHSAGLPSLIVQMKKLERKEKLVIYCFKEHKNNLLSLLTNTHIIPERLDFSIEFVEYSAGVEFIVMENLRIKPAHNLHLKKLSELQPSAESFGFLFNAEGKKIFYTGDIGEEKDLYLFDKEKIDIMISETTHVDFEKIFKSASELKIKNVYLTHIDEDEDKLTGTLPAGYVKVFDGYEIEIV
jgi:ribonuclease Z